MTTETSREALEKVKPFITDIKARILWALHFAGPLTHDEIDAHENVTTSTYRARVSELVKKDKLVRWSGDYRTNINGNRTRTWELTDAGHEWIENQGRLL